MPLSEAITTIAMEMDGVQLSVDKGTTVLEAATLCGIHIPTLCYLEGLSPYGSCRICSVELSTDGGRKFNVVASCTYEIHRELEKVNNESQAGSSGSTAIA